MTEIIETTNFDSLKKGNGFVFKNHFRNEMYAFKKISKRCFRVVYRGGAPDIFWKYYIGELVYIVSMKHDSLSFDVKFIPRKELKIWETLGLLK